VSLRREGSVEISGPSHPSFKVATLSRIGGIKNEGKEKECVWTSTSRQTSYAGLESTIGTEE
jgi:hypothetical protein